MTIKLYYDLLSQPSRALYILLKRANIKFQPCPVDLVKGAHLKEEFKRDVSKFQKVPVLHHNDFKLTESVAILRYLSREKNLPEKWYPKDSRQQARVDEFLEWQHNNTRAYCALYFQVKWLIPALLGQETTPERILRFEKRMTDNLDLLENLWFSDRPYLAGDSITAADIWAACEIEQPRMAGFDPAAGRPRLANWWERVRTETDPYYTNAHLRVNEITADTLRKEKSKRERQE